MATQEPAGISELIEKMRRRRRRMLQAFSIVIAISILTAVVWPPSYQATGTILIEQQELPPDLVRSAISSFADERIQKIKQRVMTTENLFKIIERYDLYPKLRQSAPREKILKRMLDDISFEMISADVIDPRAGRPTKATIAFSVGYSNRNPELAARVANELVSLYLQVNIENRTQDAANAADFMSEEATRLDKRIKELQAQMAKFKQEHLNSLPDQSVINTQLMNHTDDDIREVDTQLHALDQQITYLDAQLAQINPTSQVYTSTGERVLSPSDRLKYLRTEYARVSAIYSPDHPDVVRLKLEIEGLEKSTGQVSSVNDLQRQLQDTQTKLAEAQQKYGPDHPDVVRLQKQVATLQDQIKNAPPAPAKPVDETDHPDNPAYIELKAQKEGAIQQREALEKKRDELRGKLADFESRLAKAPAVERDYAELARELENDQNSYRLVEQKQLDAQQSKTLEDERKGERFTLIEPPIPPEQPSSPNRLAILLLGFVLAIGSAFAAMAGAESMDPSIRNRRDLEALLSVPPLAVLPWIETPGEVQQRARLVRYSAIGLLVSLVVALTLTHFFYRPLDVLWQVAWRRLGG